MLQKLFSVGNSISVNWRYRHQREGFPKWHLRFLLPKNARTYLSARLVIFDRVVFVESVAFLLGAENQNRLSSDVRTRCVEKLSVQSCLRHQVGKPTHRGWDHRPQGLTNHVLYMRNHIKDS